MGKMLKNNSVIKIDSNGKKTRIGMDSEGKVSVISSSKSKKRRKNKKGNEKSK